MKHETIGIIKKTIIIPLCIIMLLTNIIMIVPVKEVKYSNVIEVAQENTINITRNESKPVTSRSNMTREEVQYTIYKFIINNETTLYFEDLSLANSKKEYLLNETNNVTTTIEEVIQNNKDNISDNSIIDNTIQNYITKYKKPTTCFPTSSHYISSKYGYRSSRGDFHSGIDLSGNYGDNIYAYKSGTIIKVQYSNKSYGNMILIQHNDRTQTRYAHLSSINVSYGQYVKCGQIIGKMGSTGNSTGNHLHFEIIVNGSTVNPYNYIF